ncbi:MAG: NADH-quinone oxidoreductase subunit NuoH [Anaerolineae bacterium]
MDWVDTLLIPAIQSLVVIVGLLLFGYAYMTWVERKVAGRFTLRYGPNRAGPFGLLQPIADAFKVIFKEEIIPSEVDKPIYIMAPGLAVFAALSAFAVVPLGTSFTLFGREIRLYIADVNVGLLYLIAVAIVGIYGIILGGWASNNNFSLLGALRTSAQVIAYEIPMGLALVSLVTITGSLSLVDIVEFQQRVPLIVLQPLGFLIYFICALAEANRSPFDLPETENELVSGYATEYGGIKFGLFFMAEYVNMVVISCIATALFLGGGQWPFAHPHPLVSLAVFVAKAAVLIFLFLWVRASLPRVRYDKFMKFNWTFLLPLALANLAVTAVGVVLLG